MQLLLLPEFFHFLGFLTKGLRQLDVTLSHTVYLCKEKKCIYTFLKRLLLKPAFLADIRLTQRPLPPHEFPCRNLKAAALSKQGLPM